MTPVRAPGGPTQQLAYLPDSTGHLRPNTAESTAIAVSTEAPLAPKTLLPRPPIPSSPRAQRSSNSVPSSDTSTTADVPRAASALEASPLPSYTISAAETRPGMGGRQASRRFKLQQEMAVRGDEGQKAVARLEIAKQLRACELGAMRTHTLQKIQHPLAPAGHQSKAEADGWRHLPHDPAQPIELAAELAAEEEPPPMYKRGSVLPESLNETLEQRHAHSNG